MQYVETVIKTPKEATELGIALAKMVKAIHAALKDGPDVADLTSILSAAMSQEVVDGVKGIDLLGEELKMDKAAFVAAFMVAATKVMEDLK